MKILFVGEIVAGPGRKIVKKILPEVLKDYSIDVVLSNAENISGGRGFTPEKLKEVQMAGIDFFTGGDHMFREKNSGDFIETCPIIRPANYPSEVPGNGYHILDLGTKGSLLIINLMGRTNYGSIFSYLDDPFTKLDQILEECNGKHYTASIVDFHAEATSEKYAFSFYADGKVDAIVGTHTHVPTCDARILEKGTMVISDAGMTGITSSVLGVKKEIVIKQFLTAMNQKFEWEENGTMEFRSVLFDTESKEIKRIDKKLI